MVRSVWLEVKSTSEASISLSAQIKGLATTISGAKFQLKYPSDVLQLKGEQSHVAGEIVPEKLKQSAYWNILAEGDSYEKQEGQLTFALSDAEPWAEVDGELAKFEFEVLDPTKLENAILRLTRAEISPSGYDNRLLQGSELSLVSGQVKALEVDFD